MCTIANKEIDICDFIFLFDEYYEYLSFLKIWYRNELNIKIAM